MIDVVGSIEHLATCETTPDQVVDLIARSYAEKTEKYLDKALDYLNAFATEWRARRDTIDGA